MPTNVAVIGLDNFNQVYLRNYLNDSSHLEFHSILSRAETVVENLSYPFEDRLEIAVERARQIPGGISGVMTYWDFPSSSLAPFVAQRLKLNYADPESILKCEHKLWCREEQKKVVPTPQFCAFDPHSQDPLSQISLSFPFWIKPVIGHSSMLGFEISNRTEFDTSLALIREQIGELTHPFQYVIENTRIPEHLKKQGANLCIAEEIISQGNQYTLEGFVQNGEVVVYGIVDSIRAENEHTFSRYQYPSLLAPNILLQMEDITQKILHQFGYNNAPFNIEFFYDPKTDRVTVLEINSRISQSHSDLFLKVDGQPNQQIAVDIALGRKPRWNYRQGPYTVAAKCFIRSSEDGIVQQTPTQHMLDRLIENVPGSRVKINVQPGQRLSSLQEQESYSYELADVFIGGSSEQDIATKFELCQSLLQFEIDPIND